MTQKVALVTGGTTGIGAAIAERLAKDGFAVAATYFPGDEQAVADLPGWKAEMAEKGFVVAAFPVDITDWDSCADMAAMVKEDLGAPSVVVNNAGITSDKMFLKMSPQQWSAVISTNLTGAFNVTKQFAADMVTAGWGRIVLISSVNGQRGQAGQANYSAAKAGLIGFAKAIAQEFANKGVTVNVVAPGYTGTKMVRKIREDILKGIVDGVPMKRLAEPEEMADAVAYLVSDSAAYMTGATLSLNGGMYMS